MNEENNYDADVHILATDKIQSKLVSLMFSIEDVSKALKTKIYGGITQQECELLLTSEKKEQKIYEYILDALDTFADKIR
tara:strand:- start:30 stop:269 length:240 start_codon:yes stop_codon:yes gene_type:complete